MESLELLKEIEAWLSFNTEPSKKETAKLRKSINNHVKEQLNLDIIRKGAACAVCVECGDTEKLTHCTSCAGRY